MSEYEGKHERDDESYQVKYAIRSTGRVTKWMGTSGRYQDWVAGLRSAKLYSSKKVAKRNCREDEDLVTVIETRKILHND